MPLSPKVEFQGLQEHTVSQMCYWHLGSQEVPPSFLHSKEPPQIPVSCHYAFAQRDTR